MVEQYDYLPLSPPKAELPLLSVVSFRDRRFRERTPERFFASHPPVPKPSESAIKQFVGDFSGEVDVKSGMKLLDDMLAELDGTDASAKIHLAAQAAHARSMKFSLNYGLEREIDALTAADWLAGATVREDHVMDRAGGSLYLVNATWRAKKLKVGFRSKDGGKLSFGADVVESINAAADVGLDLDKKGNLGFDAGTRSVLLRGQDDPPTCRRRQGGARPETRSTWGGPRRRGRRDRGGSGKAGRLGNCGKIGATTPSLISTSARLRTEVRARIRAWERPPRPDVHRWELVKSESGARHDVIVEDRVDVDDSGALRDRDADDDAPCEAPGGGLLHVPLQFPPTQRAADPAGGMFAAPWLHPRAHALLQIGNDLAR